SSSWHLYEEGMPYCMDTDKGLPGEVRFSFRKLSEFVWTYAEGNVLNLMLWCYSGLKRRVNHCVDVSEYVYEHWEDDAFFGSQYLTGLNPILIRRCTALPQHFPVTDEMVHFDLNGPDVTLFRIVKGNVFLCDYKLLDEVKTNVINNEKQYLMAPLVLLHKTPLDELKPVAIQVRKTSNEQPDLPPSDSKYDWLLAKTFVRSADFHDHELNVHLLRTHLLAEVFSSYSSLLLIVHCFAHQLLLPHTRYTFHINKLARDVLISEKIGVLTNGMITIMQRALSSLTYRSLCLPEDIKDREMESVPKYYYRDDGLQLWDIIHRFVNGVLNNYYKSDSDVQKDTELQNFITDVFEKGFLSRTDSGDFSAVDELVKFVTMVIFTCSAQHAAVNHGQLDIGNWMPNFPPSLQLPPPTEKGGTNEQILLKTLPDVNVTVYILATLWLLTKQSTDFVLLGQYPDELFCEEVPRDLIEIFKEQLKGLGAAIGERNKKLDLPYMYLDPVEMENSVAI
uniref:Lipoxygenase domain-containing protein n=1 Tax=Neogobius melanostomus TaxID=47308 RepID=A0A8C6SFC7_9GOBI